MRYSPTLLRYFNDTPHAGEINGERTETAILGTLSQGHIFQLQVKTYDQQIIRAAFLAYGGADLIASGEYICQTIENQSILKLESITAESIRCRLALPRRAITAILLIEDALKSVLIDWKSKYDIR